MTASSPENLNPKAESWQTVQSGYARFTFLTPALVRMEYSDQLLFEDRASMAFLNRNVQTPFRIDIVDDDDWLVVRTDSLVLKYEIGSGPFAAENLSIDYRVGGEMQEWRPGMKPTGNLLGTYRTLDGISGDTSLELGLLSRDGWVIYEDSGTPVFTNDDPAWITARKDPKALDWYFFGYGRMYAKTLEDFSRFSGRLPLPPKYTFGVWWSRYWSYTDKELIDLVSQFHENNVPLDVLVIDMGWHLDGWTGYTWHPDYFPDPDGFLKWVKEKDLQATLNLHPADGIGKHESQFKPVCKRLGLDPEKTDRVPFNCVDPKYMEAYFKDVHRPMEKQGVDFWWIDWQQGSVSGLEGLDPLIWLNHCHWVDMERNQDRNGLRPMLFSRWGGLGNHRYQIGFSGDTFCNWPSLAFQPFFTSTASNVCFGYWSHDIGGHQPGLVAPELYTRWIQFGAFSPALRTHTTMNPDAERRIWEFPDPYFPAMKEAFQLRYDLIPYIYTAARQAYDTSISLCRPLYYHWPEEDEAYEQRDQYMFGDTLLVAPVLDPVNPVTEQALSRIWLPPGTWTHWFTGETWEGPKHIVIGTSLDEIPIFVRSGGIIPMQSGVTNTNQQSKEPIAFHIFPGKRGEYRYYEDDGKSQGYIEGKCAWTRVSHSIMPGGRNRRVTVGPTEGSYDGMPKKRSWQIVLHDVPSAREVMLDGQPLPVGNWQYDPKNLSVVIRLPERDVTEKSMVDVMFARGDAETRKAYNGLKGILAALEVDEKSREAAVSVRKLASEPVMVPGEVRDAAVKATVDALERILENKNEQGRWKSVTRLLSLVFDVSARGSVRRPNTLDVDPMICRNGIPGIDVGARLAVKPLPGWNFVGEPLLKWDNLPAGEMVSVKMTAAPAGGVQTTELKAELVIEVNGREVTLPVSEPLLPGINMWWILGPFDADPASAMATVFPPEMKIDLDGEYKGKDGKTIRWKRHQRAMSPRSDLARIDFVDFYEFWGYTANAVAYALTYVEADEDMDVQLAFGTDDGCAVWLNGEEIMRENVWRGYTERENIVPIRLKKGTNTLMFKVTQGGGSWGMGAAIENRENQPILSGIRITTNPQ